MKIATLYADWSKFGESWSTPMGIKSELEFRGHEVRHYNLYHGDGVLFPNNIRHYSNEGINRLYQEFNAGTFIPDAIFVMDYGPWDAIQLDKKLFPGVVIAKECGDEPQSHRQHWNALRRVHVMLSPDLQSVNRYHTAGCHAVHWTHFADTRLFYPREISAQFDCVTTCGPRGNGLTDEIQRSLGSRFNNERYFYGQEHAKRLHLGKMVFQCSQYKEITRRIFEGMACGRMIITDRLPPETGINDLFIEGRDILFYDNAQDAIDKIEYYSSHDVERETIAYNGYSKVLAHHTQKQRVDALEACILSAKEALCV